MSDLISKQKTIGLAAALRGVAATRSSSLPVARPPQTPRQLAQFVHHHFGLSVPARAVCPHHNSPLDYLTASFFGQQDILVWANRGGGKTLIAAVATVLDALSPDT